MNPQHSQTHGPLEAPPRFRTCHKLCSLRRRWGAQRCVNRWDSLHIAVTSARLNPLDFCPSMLGPVLSSFTNFLRGFGRIWNTQLWWKPAKTYNSYAGHFVPWKNLLRIHQTMGFGSQPVGGLPSTWIQMINYLDLDLDHLGLGHCKTTSQEVLATLFTFPLCSPIHSCMMLHAPLLVLFLIPMSEPICLPACHKNRFSGSDKTVDGWIKRSIYSKLMCNFAHRNSKRTVSFLHVHKNHKSKRTRNLRSLLSPWGANRSLSVSTP